MLTKEELLAPRFLVIADYPNSIFKVGEILSGDYDGRIFCDPNSCKYSDFPHLFQKLYWYEKRDKSELPEYVKMNYTKTHHIISYQDFCAGYFYYDIGDCIWYLSNSEPSTLEEYEMNKPKYDANDYFNIDD